MVTPPLLIKRKLTMLPFIFLLALLVFAIFRLSNFIHIFRAHAGIAYNQPDVAAAHLAGAADPRSQVVPKILHQIFHNWTDPEDEKLPSDWELMRQTCIEKNPDYEYRVSRTYSVRMLWNVGP